MKHWPWMVLGLLIIALVVGAYYGLLAIPASVGYCLEARFETLPPDDKRLKAWVQSQSGVVPHTVWISRFDPDRKLLGITFIQVRNGFGQPPLPDVDGACETLGYANPDGPFRDCADPHKTFRDETTRGD